jgi:hypothetical protein
MDIQMPTILMNYFTKIEPSFLSSNGTKSYKDILQEALKLIESKRQESLSVLLENIEGIDITKADKILFNIEEELKEKIKIRS